MIAAPIKTENENAPISPMFGKAKWFAVTDNNGSIKIHKNENVADGRAISEWLSSLGVTEIFFQHIGENNFLNLNKKSIKCFYIGEDRLLFKDAVLNYADGELLNVNIHNMDDYVKKSKSQNSF